MMSLKAPELRAAPRALAVAPTRVERRRASDRRRVTLLALVLVGLALRAGFLIADPYPVELAGLARSQGEIAHNLNTHGRWFSLNRNTTNKSTNPAARALTDPVDLDLAAADANPSFVPYRIHMPGAGLLLAAIWKVTGQERYIWLQVAQAVADSAVVLLVYWIATALYGRRRVALLAAAGYALFLPIAAMTRIPFYDPWAIDITVAVFALFLKSRAATRPLPWLLATGVATGAGMWFRSQLVLLPIGLALALVGSIGWRRAAVRGLLPAAVAVGLVLPYSFWTLSDGGQFSLVNIGTGQVLWQGLGQRANDFGAVNDDGLTFQMVHAERPDLGYARPDYDDYLKDRALRVIGDRPGFYAAVVGQRVLLSIVPLWNSGELQRARGELAAYPGSPVEYMMDRPRQATKLVLGLTAGPAMFLLAAVGLVITWRRRRTETLLLLAACAAVFAVPVALASAWRYAAPVTFVYLILGSVVIDRVLASIRAHRLRNPRRA